MAAWPAGDGLHHVHMCNALQVRSAGTLWSVAKAPTIVDLVWSSGLIFSGRSGQASLTLDSAGAAGPSPVQAIAFALAGCMMMDVAHILTRGRHAFGGLRCQLVADRAEDEPHRITRATLTVIVTGDVPAEAIDRAITLSR